jgi:hypothetical protein
MDITPESIFEPGYRAHRKVGSDAYVLVDPEDTIVVSKSLCSMIGWEGVLDGIHLVLAASMYSGQDEPGEVIHEVGVVLIRVKTNLAKSSMSLASYNALARATNCCSVWDRT